MAKKPKSKLIVETLTHDDAKHKNIPTAEHRPVLEQESPKTLRYPRNTDPDPQLVWRGKDEQDWSDLVVHAPPLYSNFQWSTTSRDMKDGNATHITRESEQVKAFRDTARASVHP